jgi:hypothetical protein
LVGVGCNAQQLHQKRGRDRQRASSVVKSEGSPLHNLCTRTASSQGSARDRSLNRVPTFPNKDIESINSGRDPRGFHSFTFLPSLASMWPWMCRGPPSTRQIHMISHSPTAATIYAPPFRVFAAVVVVVVVVVLVLVIGPHGT